MFIKTVYLIDLKFFINVFFYKFEFNILNQCSRMKYIAKISLSSQKRKNKSFHPKLNKNIEKLQKNTLKKVIGKKLFSVVEAVESVKKLI